MPRDVIFTANAAPPRATYSQAVRAGGLIFVSGTAPADPATGKFIAGDAAEQTARCLRNISAILEAAGSSLEKAVSATIILDDPDDFAAVNEERLKWYPTNPPARQGAKLPVRVPGLKVSIAMIAEA
jgi:2-iminobutanoate/2-iminopropanoate deaminase